MSAKSLQTLSDEQLILHIRNNHPDEFRIVVDRYQTKLFYYALKFIHDELKAQDVLQEAFIKAFVNINSFDVDRNFSAWLYRIVHNEAVNFIKKYGREFSVEDGAWFDNIVDEKVDLAAELDAKTKNQQVRKAVFELPVKYKDVLVLYYFEGMEYDDIAKVLNIPSNTVGTRIRRAKIRLKRLLPQGIDQ